MRGSPVVRAIATVLALLALMIPLRSLTSHHPATTSSQSPVAMTREKLHLELTSTTVPFKFQVTHNGRPIWNGESSSASVDTDVELRFPSEGIDLVLDVSWTEKKETAVRLALTPKNADPIVRTIWGTTNASEVLTFVPEK